MRSKTMLFLLFLISLTFSSTAKLTNYLSLGSTLHVKDAASDYLISLDKTFTCGFYSSGTNAYYFSIWFTNSSTLVWMGNRDNPVNGHGSSSNLVLHDNGNLVLTNVDGSTTWESNTKSINVVNAELLNSGNLVLVNPAGEVLWQSFDYPTDTLLPNQLFTRETKLVSNLAPQVFTSGNYKMLFDTNNVLKLIYDGPEITSVYWPNNDYGPFTNGRTTYNRSRIAVLDNKGTFISSDETHFNASDVGTGIKRRLTIDYDGNLRLYSLNDSSGSWVITWLAFTQQCDVHGLCGKNGICVYTPEPKCSCPPYHNPVDPTDLSKGCEPTFKRSCSDSYFVMMHHIDYHGFEINFTKSVMASFKDCRQLCLNDCSCQAFSYRPTGEAICYRKNLLFNGRRLNNYSGSMYLRVPRRAQLTKSKVLNVANLDCGSGMTNKVMLNVTYDITNKKFKWVYMYSFISIIGAFEVVIFIAGWCFLFRKYGMSASLEDGYKVISSQFRSFSYSELKTATRNFKDLVGRGGFGAVYKGVLADQRAIAVKKLEGIIQGEEEFLAEVSIIGKINHFHLARMWGFCMEGQHKLLVYEHAENGSLDKHLFSSSINNSFLGWKDRFKIAVGIAKGLAYLHHECLEWVIHCDVKPENILLDTDFEPKISDFGLAKLCQRDDHKSSQMSRIRGTKGYMAPEWTTNLPLTAKVDVYSYGVVILELVRGIRLSSQAKGDHIDEEDHEEEGIADLNDFVQATKKKINNKGEDIESLVDPRLEGRFSRNQAILMIKVGTLCVENDRKKRPTMESVVEILTECDDENVMHIPEKF